MKKLGQRIFFVIFLLVAALIPLTSFSAEISPPSAIHQLFEVAKKNANWKIAFLTGPHAQIVFMNVSPATNPKNEIGMETHHFDQIIFIVEGRAKAILSGKVSEVGSGDIIFIPQGTLHNVVNLNAKNPLKIISIYSSMDIPANSVYRIKSDEASH